MTTNTPLENELFALVGKLTLELERERENVKEARKNEKLLLDQLEMERRKPVTTVPCFCAVCDMCGMNKFPPIPPLERSSAKTWSNGITRLTNADDDEIWEPLQRETTQSWLQEGVYLGEPSLRNNGLTLADLE
jgi:hypothetical protein